MGALTPRNEPPANRAHPWLSRTIVRDRLVVARRKLELAPDSCRGSSERFLTRCKRSVWTRHGSEGRASYKRTGRRALEERRLLDTVGKTLRAERGGGGFRAPIVGRDAYSVPHLVSRSLHCVATDGRRAGRPRIVSEHHGGQSGRIASEGGRRTYPSAFGPRPLERRRRGERPRDFGRRRIPLNVRRLVSVVWKEYQEVRSCAPRRNSGDLLETIAPPGSQSARLLRRGADRLSVEPFAASPLVVGEQDGA